MRVSHSYQSLQSLTEEEFITFLRESQLKFPVTEDEVDAFINTIGETKVELPDGFKSANEYFHEYLNSQNPKKVFAMAAQRQKKGYDLSGEVIEKLRSDMLRNDNLVKPDNNGISE